MADEKTRINLTLLLPDVPDERDDCVRRLQDLIRGQEGVSRTHVVAENGGPPALCLHYDPAVVSLAQVERLARAAGADLSEAYGHAVLTIRAVDSEDAARRIEAELLSITGVLAASANLAAQRARVEYDRRAVTLERIRGHLESLGYGPASPSVVAEHACGAGHDHDHDNDPAHGHDLHGREHRVGSRYERHKELVWSLLAGVLAAVGFLGEHWGGWPSRATVPVFLLAYTLGSFELLHHLLADLRRGRFTFNIDLLMLLAAVGAAILGHWAEGAFLLFMFSLAHALEHYALDRARRAIRALADLAPPVARVVRDGAEVEVPVGQVPVGQVVLVRPGERIPVDGRVASGHSAVDQSPITGESVPVDKGPDDEVFAGTINGEGALEVSTTRAAGDRTLDRVVQLVEEAQTQKAPTQRFTEKFESWFVPAVLVADVLVIVLPPLLGWWTWSTSFYRGMALLVGASPCALALGTPAAVLAGIAQAARKGVLIKGGVHLENLGTLRAIAFDKTGTLTTGRPEVTDTVPLDGATAEELLRVAGAVERKSGHPLARAIVRRSVAAGVELPEAGELHSLTARGVRSEVGGEPVEVGSLRLWEHNGAAVAGAVVPQAVKEATSSLQSAGRSVVVVRHGPRWLGAIGLFDQARPGVRDVLDCMRGLGIRPLVMLTGDHAAVAESVGRAVGVDEVRAGLLPEQKVEAVKAMLANHGRVGMVGDGVNDAPALAAATVGVAMGGAGAAAALETADVALMGDDLSRLLYAVELSRKANAIIRQNLGIALGVIVVLVVFAVAGVVRIGPAVFFHEGSTLVVIFNALRLLAFEGGLTASRGGKATAPLT